MLYFAFGSNLLTSRLQRRCPSARVVTRALAPGHRVVFEKLSEDTSGKATLVTCKGPDLAVGVVYELSKGDVDELDAFEGPGYRRVDAFPVTCLDTGQGLQSCTYVAKEMVPGLRPYDWYLAMIVAGLAEHDIDERYAEQLRMTAYDTDPQRLRQTRQNALQDLAGVGCHDHLGLLHPPR